VSATFDAGLATPAPAAAESVPAGRFRIWYADEPADRDEWAAAWAAWPGREVFAHPGYVALDLAPGERAVCAAHLAPDACILHPFVLRDLRGLDAWEPAMGPAFDIVGPYGYGGPYAWSTAEAVHVTRAVERAAGAFWRDFDRWAVEGGIVSEFVRLSLFADDLAPYPGRCETKQRNVVRDLTLDDARLWADVEHKVRKNVRKAERSGVQIVVDLDGSRLDGFLAVYHGTMQRRGAATTYLFPRTYFERLVAELPGQFAFFHAIHEGAVVSSELVLVSARRAYSFLGGTHADAFGVRPNDLLKYTVFRWARDRGLGAFVLGGGPTPDDGIFRYKLSFAPGGVVPFRVGTRVLRPDLYERLDARRAARRAPGDDPGGRFPAYRF
jgi:hypothetical protein